MTENPSSPESSTDPKTEPVHAPPPRQAAYVETPEERRRPNRVTTIAAWVGIVAGVVFIVAVVFFSGFVLGKNANGGGHHRDGGPGHGHMMFRDGPRRACSRWVRALSWNGRACRSALVSRACSPPSRRSPVVRPPQRPPDRDWNHSSSYLD